MSNPQTQLMRVGVMLGLIDTITSEKLADVMNYAEQLDVEDLEKYLAGNVSDLIPRYRNFCKLAFAMKAALQGREVYVTIDGNHADGT